MSVLINLNSFSCVSTVDRMAVDLFNTLQFMYSCGAFQGFCVCVFFPQLEKKEMTPPFKPQISDDYGLENFDTQFTNEPVQLTPDDE